jgi:peptide/nickel transport system permease protein
VTRYIVSRVLQIVPVLFGVSIVVFLLVRLIPGDPATAMLGGHATPETIREARAQLHLNEPIWRQYWDYLVGWLHGQFGVSFFYGDSVWSLTLPRIPVTLELIGYATLLAILITVPLATVAALRRGGSVDHGIRLLGTTALGIPTFWLGLILSLYLGVKVKLFPITGQGSGGLDTLYHLTLPALTIAISMVPLLLRALRSSLVEVLSSDFMVTAKACGLRRRYVVWSYMLRNSMIPLITVLSINLGFLIGGTVIVEEIFGIPGIGSLLIGSISTRDYSIIQLVTLVLAVFVLATNLFTDIAYAILDPRVNFDA